ncbi:MAG: M50 family metallopeptidase [Mycobacteriales bacterium]
MLSAQPAPPDWVIWTTGLVALVVVGSGLIWPFTRYVITIAHEGGHAIMAVMTGRKLRGVRLHSDTSGLTLSSGKPRGFGMVLTGLAGYIAPSLLGLACASLLSIGRLTPVLWLCIALLAAMLVIVRNIFGVISVVTTGLILGAISYFGSDGLQAATAYGLTWFLLLGGVRPVIELQKKRYWGEAHNSDADQLGEITPFPGLFWVLVFALVTIGCLGFSMAALLPAKLG